MMVFLLLLLQDLETNSDVEISEPSANAAETLAASKPASKFGVSALS